MRVDSIFPIDEEIRRFQTSIPDSVSELSAAAVSRDELVTRFFAALESNDRAAMQELALTTAEFAYLFYPHTRYTRRPYELSPALLWFQLENSGSKGLARVLIRYGGRPLASRGYVCSAEPEIEGPNRLWSGCTVQHVADSGDTVSLSLFGGIIERDGRFKFINFANRL